MNIINLLIKISILTIIFILYRLGTYIPLYGIDYTILKDILSDFQNTRVGVVNMLTGGSIYRMSLFYGYTIYI